MSSNSTQHDTSSELLIQRFRNGVKLVRPEIAAQLSKTYSVSDMLQSPLYHYFLNSKSEIQNINQPAALIAGWDSSRHAIGTTVRIVANKKSADLLIAHDNAVMERDKILINEEPCTRLDGYDFITTAIKFPWYNSDGEIIGLFGCSILSGDKNPLSLAVSLTLLLNTGLLEKSEYPHQSNFDKKYNLSFRQSQCLLYVVKGMTMKEIGHILNLSPRTVEHYIESIKIKLSCKKRSELIEKYMAYHYHNG